LKSALYNQLVSMVLTFGIPEDRGREEGVSNRRERGANERERGEEAYPYSLTTLTVID